MNRSGLSSFYYSSQLKIYIAAEFQESICFRLTGKLFPFYPMSFDHFFSTPDISKSVIGTNLRF